MSKSKLTSQLKIDTRPKIKAQQTAAEQISSKRQIKSLFKARPQIKVQNRLEVQQESKKEHCKKILGLLKKNYPDAKCALYFNNPLQLLIATILSAQCTDVRVNMVTPALFLRYPNAQAFADADIMELEQMIRSTGFYRVKAKNIISTCKIIFREFQGMVPMTMHELLILPGVARKTANVVLWNAYGKNEGIVVDTHVRRLSQRLHLSLHNDPLKIERDLIEVVPKKDWGNISHLLIEHGRKICKAQRPRCEECFLLALCPFGQKNMLSMTKKL